MQNRRNIPVISTRVLSEWKVLLIPPSLTINVSERAKCVRNSFYQFSHPYGNKISFAFFTPPCYSTGLAFKTTHQKDRRGSRGKCHLARHLGEAKAIRDCYLRFESHFPNISPYLRFI